MFMDRSELYPAVTEAIKEGLAHIRESARHAEVMATTRADFHEMVRQLISTDLAGVESLVEGREVAGLGPFQGDGDYYVWTLWHLSDLEESKPVLPVIEWASMVCLSIGCDGWYKYGVRWWVRVALSARRRNGSGPVGQKWIHAARSVLAYNQVDWNSGYRLLISLLIELTYVDTVGDDVIIAGNASVSIDSLSMIECLQLAALGRMSLSHPNLSRFSAKEICEAVETVFGKDI